MIIDSIQTLHTAALDASPGSVGQVRECTSELMRFAKTTNIPMVLIGHITKDGFIAGPKVLEHMVDCVLQFEGDRDHAYRLLRPLKNRFGSTNELGIYEMRGSGLAVVEDPSQVLLGDRGERPSGVCVAATLEGMRPLLIEVQALVSQCGLRHTATQRHRLRPAPHEHAAGRAGEALRFPAWAEGCVPQPRRRLPCGGARDRPGRGLCRCSAPTRTSPYPSTRPSAARWASPARSGP